MDRIDRKILDQLQQDADIPNKALADRVGLAPSSCLRRVRRLKDQGYITKIVAVADRAKLGRPIQVIVTVKLVDSRDSKRDPWVKSLINEPSVLQAYDVSGETDAIIVMSLQSMEEYQQLAQRLFSQDESVVNFITHFVLEQHKFDLAV